MYEFTKAYMGLTVTLGYHDAGTCSVSPEDCITCLRPPIPILHMAKHRFGNKGIIRISQANSLPHLVRALAKGN